MRRAALALLLAGLAACHRGGQQNSEAVRQAVLDFLATSNMKLNLQAMDVKVDTVQFAGDKADANVSFALKGNSEPMMRMKYHLENRNDK